MPGFGRTCCGLGFPVEGPASGAPAFFLPFNFFFGFLVASASIANHAHSQQLQTMIVRIDAGLRGVVCSCTLSGQSLEIFLNSRFYSAHKQQV